MMANQSSAHALIPPSLATKGRKAPSKDENAFSGNPKASNTNFFKKQLTVYPVKDVQNTSFLQPQLSIKPRKSNNAELSDQNKPPRDKSSNKAKPVERFVCPSFNLQRQYDRGYRSPPETKKFQHQGALAQGFGSTGKQSSNSANSKDSTFKAVLTQKFDQLKSHASQ